MNDQKKNEQDSGAAGALWSTQVDYDSGDEYLQKIFEAIVFSGCDTSKE